MTYRFDDSELPLPELMDIAEDVLGREKCRLKLNLYNEFLAKHVDGRRHTSDDEEVRRLGADLRDLRASFSRKISELPRSDQIEDRLESENLPQVSTYPRAEEDIYKNFPFNKRRA